MREFCFFQAEDGIRDAHKGLEFRRVLFRSPISFVLRLKAGCRSNRVCLSGEERDGEGGGKSMALARAGRPSAADAHLGVGCRAWRTTWGGLFSFRTERAAALGVPRDGALPGEERKIVVKGRIVAGVDKRGGRLNIVQDTK